MGYTYALTSSDDLDYFAETYNYMNRGSLYAPLKGFSGSAGVRFQVGYRNVKGIHRAITAGYQSFENRDIAQFYNGANRTLSLKMAGLFIEGELGKMLRRPYFINGVMTFYLSRNVKLKSSYSDPSEVASTSISGNYEGFAAFSADIGVAFGFLREPFMLTCKISFPIYTGGSSNLLRDTSPEKIEQGTQVFPDDYEKYLFYEPYTGVKSNIDGWKILITGSFIKRILR